MSRMKSDSALRCEIEADELVVRIGVGRLAWSAKKKNGGPIPNNIGIHSAHQFAMDVATELARDNDLGETPLDRLLDAAMIAAMENGSVGLNYPQARRPKTIKAK